MSYYFAIVGTQDNPLFEYEFGTSKQGGDGQAHFVEQARHLNQFVVHSSLDVVEEVQWAQGQMYLKCIDKFFHNYVSCFVTGVNAKFFLLHQPPSATQGYMPGVNGSSGVGSGAAGQTASSSALPAASVSTRASTAIGANPTSAATEEAIKNFFLEVYESWVKATMNPFYRTNMEIKSPVFRTRVAAAGKKYL